MRLNAQVIEVMQGCCRGSHEGRMAFPAVVASLAGAGVESYHADYRRSETTYYLASGDSHVVPWPEKPPFAAGAFAADGVAAAVRGAQRGDLQYPEFVRRTVRAGCIGYVVWIAGRQVHYYGRGGETHVERFPPAD